MKSIQLSRTQFFVVALALLAIGGLVGRSTAPSLPDQMQLTLRLDTSMLDQVVSPAPQPEPAAVPAIYEEECYPEQMQFAVRAARLVIDTDGNVHFEELDPSTLFGTADPLGQFTSFMDPGVGAPNYEESCSSGCHTATADPFGSPMTMQQLLEACEPYDGELNPAVLGADPTDPAHEMPTVH